MPTASRRTGCSHTFPSLPASANARRQPRTSDIHRGRRAMSYDSKRCDAQLAAFDQPIRDFITRYNANTSTKRQTVFLFPGGMGSRLIRANTAYPAPPSYYNTTWLDCSILLDAATEMQMQGNYDYQKHIVVADSTVDFMTLRPYHGFTQWCDTHGLDWFVLSWDWRRHLEETVDL